MPPDQSPCFLQKITFVLWSVFPSLQVCQLLGIISFHEHRVFRVLGDVFVKTVYSVSILSGNFCLLDTISELRISQMRESQAESEDNFDRSEKLNEALKMQCVEADTTARMAKRFVANLSHELRTPLNSVIAFNSLLLESGLEPIHQEYVKSSLTSAEALLGIIGQVLDYSKLEHSVSQEVVVDAAPFDLNQVCDELLDVVVARVAARKVQFVFETWQPIPFLVGDKFRLRQVLINLADNAVKFSRDDNGVVILSITADQIDNGTLMVQIDVTDNGIGIPEKKRDLIFQPFSQVCLLSTPPRKLATNALNPKHSRIHTCTHPPKRIRPIYKISTKALACPPRSTRTCRASMAALASASSSRRRLSRPCTGRSISCRPRDRWANQTMHAIHKAPTSFLTGIVFQIVMIREAATRDTAAIFE